MAVGDLLPYWQSFGRQGIAQVTSRVIQFLLCVRSEGLNTEALVLPSLRCAFRFLRLSLCPQVPQRIEEHGDGPEDSGGVPGVWGSWGPWSACSRSCSGGVMEQTRPCLPAYYRERGYRRPGRHFPAPERALPHPGAHREDSLSAYPGHVISAIRTSVPLHRSDEQPWAPPRNSSSGPGGRAALRGSRHSQGPRHSARPDSRYGLGTAVPGHLGLLTPTGTLLETRMAFTMVTAFKALP